MMSVEDKEIKAVHITDLEKLLQKYEQSDDFNNGQIKCHICSDTVSMNNVGSIQLLDNRLRLTCNKIACYDQIVKQSISINSP
ncbi:MAG: hypothetical protein EPO37_05460 [Nitrosarchaeum sp.]|nr:MAG: hypothetical protein EPO37_05460 [Nitrosarchaeum sp.]